MFPQLNLLIALTVYHHIFLIVCSLSYLHLCTDGTGSISYLFCIRVFWTLWASLLVLQYVYYTVSSWKK